MIEVEQLQEAAGSRVPQYLEPGQEVYLMKRGAQRPWYVEEGPSTGLPPVAGSSAAFLQALYPHQWEAHLNELPNSIKGTGHGARDC